MDRVWGTTGHANKPPFSKRFFEFRFLSPMDNDIEMDIDKTTLVQCSRCDGTGEVEHPWEGRMVDCSGCLGEGTRETLTFPEMVDTLRALDIGAIDSVDYDGETGDMDGHAFVRFEGGQSVSIIRSEHSMGGWGGLFEADTPLRREPYGRRTVEGLIELVRKSSKYGF